MAKFLCHATVHTNFLEKKTLKEKKIYLDFAKAFDTVPHRRLIGKLHAYGIKGNILNWIIEFLRDRTQVVRVNEKDLGVIIDSELLFEEHISNKVRVANAIVGLIRRSFTHLDCKSFTKIYTAFVRPHLEYAQSVWAPHFRKHINMLENVQIRASKLVDGLGNVD